MARTAKLMVKPNKYLATIFLPSFDANEGAAFVIKGLTCFIAFLFFVYTIYRE